MHQRRITNKKTETIPRLLLISMALLTSSELRYFLEIESKK